MSYIRLLHTVETENTKKYFDAVEILNKDSIFGISYDLDKNNDVISLYIAN